MQIRRDYPLTELEPTLPSEQYYDPAHFRLELEKFWYKDWICIGRDNGLKDAGQFRQVRIGDQNILVVRGDDGELRAFHNTCRHRGSILCEAHDGVFQDGRIVCPYHAWTYSLKGELTHTPWRLPSDDFNVNDYPLYEVDAGEWAGFVFLNLEGGGDESLSDALGTLPALFDNWELADSACGYVYEKVVNCNWKVFWENFSECYHCPGIHPELSHIVPRFRKGILRASDEPDWDAQTGPDPDTEPRLAPGMVTWTSDGTSKLPKYPNLTQAERDLGQTFGTLMPSCFIACHVDFVRFGHVLPLGPEQIAVSIECLFPGETLRDERNDISDVTSFIERLTDQDVRVCELNQRGLHSRAHRAGVLVPQEYYTHSFHRYVRDRLSTP